MVSHYSGWKTKLPNISYYPLKSFFHLSSPPHSRCLLPQGLSTCKSFCLKISFQLLPCATLLLNHSHLSLYIIHIRGSSISLLYFCHSNHFSIFLCTSFIQRTVKTCSNFSNQFIRDLLGSPVLFPRHSLWWHICRKDDPTRERNNSYEYD